MTITMNARLTAMLENYDAETIEIAYQLTAYARYGVVSEDDLREYLANEVAREEVTLSDYNEYLTAEGYEGYWDMDELDEFISQMSPAEAFRIGRFSKFSENDDFFTFNGYGNIVSCTARAVEKEMHDDAAFLKWYIDENNIMDDYEVDDIIDACDILLRVGY